MLDLVRQLTRRNPLPPLKPQQVWDAALDERIASEVGRWAEGLPPDRRTDALAFQAGLHLLNDSLDAAHELAQRIETSTGSYWHGIMHRLEGDYGNAQYWFARVGRHPVMEEMRRQAESISPGESWDPIRFVERVRRQAALRRDETTERMERLQSMEAQLLLRYCYKQATGEELPET